MAQKKGSAAARTLKPASWRPLSESINAGNEQVYAFNAQGGGYVIVAGDDRIDKVLAYSLNGKIDASTIPAAMQSMLTSYAEQIDYMQSHGLSPHKSPTHPAIAPLMKTTWGQRHALLGLHTEQLSHGLCRHIDVSSDVLSQVATGQYQ